MLASPRRQNCLMGVQVGRRGNIDGVNLGISQQSFHTVVSALRPVSVRKPLRRIQLPPHHRHQLVPSRRGNRRRHLALRDLTRP